MGKTCNVSVLRYLRISHRAAGIGSWPRRDGDDRGSTKVQPDVSGIIVKLNRRELLARCLNSLWRQTFSNFEVIVVDNASTDGSMEFLQTVREPRLQTVSLPVNKGFAGGCNAGIAHAEGRYIATLNNDAEADPRWIEELVSGMESDPAVGMCASKILFHGDRTRIDKAGHLMYPDGLNHGRGSGEPDRGQFECREEVLFPDAAAALYRRGKLFGNGLIPPHLFALRAHAGPWL